MPRPLGPIGGSGGGGGGGTPFDGTPSKVVTTASPGVLTAYARGDHAHNLAVADFAGADLQDDGTNKFRVAASFAGLKTFLAGLTIAAAQPLSTPTIGVDATHQLTVPTYLSGTLATLAGAEVLSNKTLGTNLAGGGFEATNFADPTTAQSLATKHYVDALFVGLGPKPSVAVTTNGTPLSTTSPYTVLGDVMTAASNGAFPTISGVTLTATSPNPTFLLKEEASSVNNGIWNLTTTGSGATPWAAKRIAQLDTGAAAAGAYVYVEADDANNADTGWACTALPGSDVVGTNNLTWTQIFGPGSYLAGTGLTLTGRTFAIDSTVATLAGAQNLTNKTITSAALAGTFTGNHTYSGQVTFSNGTAPIISSLIGPTSGVQHTIPGGSSDTLAVLTATQTFTGAITMNALTLGGSLNANSNKITSLAAGTASGDAIHAGQHAAPVSLGASNADGTSTNFALADHLHLCPGLGLMVRKVNGSANGLLGTGADGALHVTSGTTTIGGIKNYSSILIDAGTTLTQNGGSSTGPILCTGAITVNGTIHANGNDASGGTGGTVGYTVGTYMSTGTAGANGVAANTNGANGGALSNALGGCAAANNGLGSANGGKGGVGTGSPNTAGVCSATALTAIDLFVITTVCSLFLGVAPNASNSPAGSWTRLNGGGGGGSGSGGTSGTSGGGGGGGAPLGLAGQSITNNGTISANGGKGGNATASSGAGGGGGGGAGFVATASYTYIGNNPVANGGTHGNGDGSGTNGNDGNPGYVIQQILTSS